MNLREVRESADRLHNGWHSSRTDTSQESSHAQR